MLSHLSFVSGYHLTFTPDNMTLDQILYLIQYSYPFPLNFPFNSSLTSDALKFDFCMQIVWLIFICRCIT